MKNDIRFLLTQSCNYNCYFCHHEGTSCRSVTTELSVQDYVTLYSVYSNLEGWNGVTLSGGEPLLYKDILELVKALYNEGAEITLITNGYFLLEHMDVLKYLNRINISLHTTREEDYNNIVQRKNVLGKVLNGLQVASEIFPSLKIRLNVTPTKSNNWSSELLEELIDYAKKINATIKFTELFPNTDDDCVSIVSMEEELKKLGYEEKPSYGRTRKFEKDICIYLTQCTCSKAILTPDPLEYCRKNHDLYDDKFSDLDTRTSLIKLLNELNIINYIEPRTLENIIHSIEHLGYKGGFNHAQISPEGRIVQDSDRLDSIGAIGIARVFAYGGKKGIPIYDPEMGIVDVNSEKDYRTGKRHSINHFYEKLLKIGETMNTEEGKKIAVKRTQVLLP